MKNTEKTQDEIWTGLYQNHKSANQDTACATNSQAKNIIHAKAKPSSIVLSEQIENSALRSPSSKIVESDSDLQFREEEKNKVLFFHSYPNDKTEHEQQQQRQIMQSICDAFYQSLEQEEAEGSPSQKTTATPAQVFIEGANFRDDRLQNLQNKCSSAAKTVTHRSPAIKSRPQHQFAEQQISSFSNLANEHKAEQRVALASQFGHPNKKDLIRHIWDSRQQIPYPKLNTISIDDLNFQQLEESVITAESGPLYASSYTMDKQSLDQILLNEESLVTQIHQSDEPLHYRMLRITRNPAANFWEKYFSALELFTKMPEIHTQQTSQVCIITDSEPTHRILQCQLQEAAKTRQKMLSKALLLLKAKHANKCSQIGK